MTHRGKPVTGPDGTTYRSKAAAARALGDAENTFGLIAAHWTWWLQGKLTSGAVVTDYDVAQMMVGLKQARAKANPQHRDNYIDEVGYAAIAGELAANA